jgi:hypothetical protein
MRKQAHHYEVYELKDGFKIVPSESDRPPVTYKMDKRGFWFQVKKGENLSYDRFDYIPLYAYYPLVDRAVDRIYDTWNPPKRSESHKREVAVTKYCKRSTGKSLNKIIHEIWKRKRDSLDPTVIALHKKLFSVSKGTGNWERVNAILKNRKKYKYLIDDLLKYSAARIAILHSYGFEDNALLEDWKIAYAKDAKVYTSLNKTLMNFPGGVVYYNALSLSMIKLPEPVTTRIRIYAYAMIARSHVVIQHNSEEKLIRVLAKSTDEDIKKAIQYMWHYFPATFTGDFRKTKGIEHAFTLIFDYPPSMIGDWNILGLAKRAELYQHDLALQQQIRLQEWEEQRVRYEAESAERAEKWRKEQEAIKTSKTALPPIKLPEVENIGFLDSYEMVVQEGIHMEHCIANYAEAAVKGRCYLFHVNYEGEMASVEVNPSGFVNQSYGPRDTINKASEYGRKVLTDWAKKLQNKTPVLRMSETKALNENVTNTGIDNGIDINYYATLPLAEFENAFPF